MSSTKIIKRGALIVVEGMDRSGKSTQCKKLVESLEKRKISSKLLTFPDRTTFIGKLIDEYLKNKNLNVNDQTIHLLFSANRWESMANMTKLLYEGVTLIIDRYSYSGIAYSSIKKNMDLDWCKQPEVGLPKPDRVFLLTLDEEESSKRPGFGNERYEDSEIQKKVAEVFLKFCEEEDNWTKIDAAGTIEEIQEKLLEQCLDIIEEAKSKPLDSLKFHSFL